MPVISAVGHEVDLTIADLAADMRAPTPSAAAELAAPDISTIKDSIDSYEKRAERAVMLSFNRAADRFTAINSRLAAQSPESRLTLIGQQLTDLDNRMGRAFERYTEKRGSELCEKIARLDSLSPLKVMARGYSLVYSGDELVRSSDDIENGSEVTLRFDKGGAKAEITEKW